MRLRAIEPTRDGTPEKLTCGEAVCVVVVAAVVLLVAITTSTTTTNQAINVLRHVAISAAHELSRTKWQA